jgi:cytochrome c-type biogenesis protein CcmH/NrfG
MAKNKALNDTFNAGKDALAAKNYDAAVTPFQKGTEMDPNQNVIWANLADAYVGQADSQDRRRSAGGARQGAPRLIQGDRAEARQSRLPQQLRAHLSESQEVRRSASRIEQGCAAGSSASRPLLLQSRRRVREQRAVGPAEVAFKKAIEANPEYADAQFQYATALSAKLTTGADGKVVAPDPE